MNDDHIADIIDNCQMVASTQMKVLSSLHARLLAALQSGEGGTITGAVYGLEVAGVRIIVGAAGQTADQQQDKSKPELELLNEMIPCGVEPVGVFGVGCSCEELVGVAAQLPPPTQPDLVPVVLSVQEAGLVARLCQGDTLGDTVEVEEMSQQEYSSLVTVVRVRGRLQLECGLTASEVSNAFRHLIEKVSCPYGSFMLEGGRVIFLHKFMERRPSRGWTGTVEQADEEDCILVGVEEKDVAVSQLWQFTQQLEEDDGWGGPKKAGKVEPRDRMEFSLLWNYANPACTSRTIGCAPIVHREVKTGDTVVIPVPIDALGVVSSSATANSLMEVLKGAVGRQVGDVAAAVLSELKMKNSVSNPEVFHFLPEGLAHHITLVYSQAATMASFETFRRSVHTSFLLATDRPLFRRCNALDFSRGEKLRNVHRGLETKHGVAGGEAGLVRGSYTYHHYMQDSFDDDGWGCAYRSLQTIISWFRQQGYTETEVPTHQQIQKCLVDIGDKETKFIGSKQWIGSTEVGFVLETACGVQSRFVSVSQGADLGSKARELLIHFRTEGTPVMIGGGVYAHTILGVAWDEATGDTKWLILDPHYTGAEDIKTIHSKGWCGWKGQNFWNQTAFYNMCLPQRPKEQI